jgi:hypothetical protein
MTSLAAPFPASADFRMLSGQSKRDVDFERYDNVRLAGLPISSNSTGMVHSEQMYSLDGAIQRNKSQATGGEQIVNGTQFDLHSACIVKREGDRLIGSWIGHMPAGKSTPLAFMDRNFEKDKPIYLAERKKEEDALPQKRLNLEPMFQLALSGDNIDDGETRLVARIDEVLPGQEITPAASQIQGATLVVAHLGYAKPPRPQRDRNVRQDVKATTELPVDDEPIEF